MSQLERLEHLLSLCSSARRLANAQSEPLVARLLDMLLLELGETLAKTPGHRVRATQRLHAAPEISRYPDS